MAKKRELLVQEPDTTGMSRTEADRARQSAAVERIRAELTEKVTDVLGGLFKEPHEKGYNPDAEKTKAECSMRTHTAIALAEQLGITKSIEQNSRPIGLVVIKERIHDAREWEAEARLVDAQVVKR